MVTTISFAIGHSGFSPDRRERLEWLLARIADEGLPDHLSVTTDLTGRRDAWANLRTGLIGGIAAGASHIVILQDDAIPCLDFLATVRKIIESRPDEVVALYCPRAIAREALAAGAHWLTMGDGIWGVASIIPEPLAVDFLEWEADHISADCPSSDARVAMWMEKVGRLAYVTTPSIVEHGAPTASTLGYNNPKKVAAAFVGKDVSGLTVNWSSKATVRAGGRLPRSYFERWYRNG